MSEQQADTGADIETIRGIMVKTAAVCVVIGIAATFVFWVGWVRAPSPHEVCAHKIALIHETAGQQQAEAAGALVGQLEATCVSNIDRKIQLRGKLVYAEYAKCVTSATSLSDAERC